MTYQEAIQQFKERLAIQDYKEQIPEYYEAMELAVKALEMRIPVSRIVVEGEYICPNCKMLMPRQGYCGCGQRVY